MKKRYAILLGAAAAGVYGAVTGTGIFNKLKYKEQTLAVEDYIRAHYPNAKHSEITSTQKGYMTVISRGALPKIVLYITKTPEGVYVFNETEVINS